MKLIYEILSNTVLGLSKPEANKNTLMTTAQPCELSPWQGTGDVFYLLDTLKVECRTEYGVLTLERLPDEQLEELKAGCTDMFSNMNVHQNSCITLSLCGVGVDQLADKTRSKGMSNAATLRIFMDNSVSSECSFTHVLDLSDEKNNELSKYSRSSVNRLQGISLTQFLSLAEEQNKRFLEKFNSKLGMNADNFQSVFTQLEQQSLDQLLC